MSPICRVRTALLVSFLWFCLGAGSSSAVDSKMGATASKKAWSDGLSTVVAVRVGRPTGQLTAIAHFYVDGIGLPIIGGFQDHAGGFSGIILGLPGIPYHLEFTQTSKAKPDEGRAPTEDNNLVIYFRGPVEVAAMAKKLAAMGFPAVQPPNPYWVAHGAVTVPDPDGWRVILMPSAPDL